MNDIEKQLLAHLASAQSEITALRVSWQNAEERLAQIRAILDQYTTTQP